MREARRNAFQCVVGYKTSSNQKWRCNPLAEAGVQDRNPLQDATNNDPTNCTPPHTHRHTHTHTHTAIHQRERSAPAHVGDAQIQCDSNKGTRRTSANQARTTLGSNPPGAIFESRPSTQSIPADEPVCRHAACCSACARESSPRSHGKKTTETPSPTE